MYQFIHIDTYAETVSAIAASRRTKVNKNGERNGTKSLLNVHQVIAEANREPDAIPHIPHPQRPTTIYGPSLPLTKILSLASKTRQVDSMNRKLRKDTPILLAGIASYPRCEYELNKEKFNLWLSDVLAWLKKMYRTNLQNVTLHLDEEHPHIHFYVISPDGRAKQLHAGYQAESLVDPKDNKAKPLAYKSAMRGFQNQYFLAVASKHGMVRSGPNRQRKSRAVYNEEKANAELLAIRVNDVELIEIEAIKCASIKSELMLNAAKIQVANMLANGRKEAKRRQEEALRWAKNALENMRRLSEAEAKVKALDAELITKQNELDYFVSENLELQRKLTIQGVAP